MTFQHSKKYYTIGEVAQLLNVTTSLIRFWEKKFPGLRPQKNDKGMRRYTTANLTMLRRIYHLVKEQGYTLAGAQAALQQQPGDERGAQREAMIQSLKALRQSLTELRGTLSEKELGGLESAGGVVAVPGSKQTT